MDFIENCELKIMSAIENYENRLLTIRAGRANPAMLNGINAECYGVMSPINTMANITVHDGKQLFIKPFDRGNLKSIEKAINEANLGINPTNNGEVIILTVPTLTEETRRDYVKQAKQIAEEAKISLRNIRQDVNTQIKNSEMPEDEEEGYLKDVQDMINKYNKKIDEILSEKEKELMAI
ncbi:MAG: ribosome recycling factor [Bacilli bacterium]|nr:ribosome recycling factor [Bacilli bacterium]